MAKRYVAILGFSTLLAGCATPDQARFQTDVSALAKPGMTIADATSRLQQDGFTCDARSAAPAITCTKDWQHLLPYTCLGRVNLVAADGKVDRVIVKDIICAGL